ncbi:alginate export family protein [Saccharicrinis fermentans]|uniref:Alginate export domain-containing protein n=1 Tax=Saccharicrinis fermentans DSM 9555 = JCM 21142 TaxID=869213 RepID=W7XX09_9BACT|nr:alginate export family protein [Saccharicrinis fermentans]GAF02960.1 hypothetical protein JCM21142_41611 [Saccharicrinis fermentans DSM 9555 = JCM 21142]
MRLLKLLFFGEIFVLPILLSAQTNKLQLSAEFRSRIILDHGYQSPQMKNHSTTFYSTQRTRFNTLFINTKIQTYLSIQDIRIWGDDDNFSSNGSYGNTQSLCLHQGWVKLTLMKSLSLKVGRQIFSYDDQRILSARNWNNYQVTYDAVLAEYKKNQHRVHLAFSYNANHKSDQTYPAKLFKTYSFIHYKHNADALSLSGIAVITGNTLTDTTEQVYYRATYGANMKYKNPQRNIRLSAYYQHKLNNHANPLSAFCVSAYAAHKITRKTILGIGYDLISGDNSSTSTNQQFDLLYGRRHGWYGYMDYFSTTPQQGLQDILARATYNTDKKTNISLHYHYFLLATHMHNNIHKKINKRLGQELDFHLKYKIQDATTLEFGYSLFSPTNTLKQLKTIHEEKIKTPHFCYIMCTIKPSIWIQH